MALHRNLRITARGYYALLEMHVKHCSRCATGCLKANACGEGRNLIQHYEQAKGIENERRKNRAVARADRRGQ